MDFYEFKIKLISNCFSILVENEKFGLWEGSTLRLPFIFCIYIIKIKHYRSYQFFTVSVSFCICNERALNKRMFLKWFKIQNFVEIILQSRSWGELLWVNTSWSIFGSETCNILVLVHICSVHNMFRIHQNKFNKKSFANKS